jgi:predicted MPP superfamily phosphohydrolase
MKDPVASSPQSRAAWRGRRASMELDGRRFTPHGILSMRSASILITRLAEPLVRAVGLRPRAMKNAAALVLTEVDVVVSRLPPAFDGYRILHLSDLHVDQIPGLLEKASGLVKGLRVDLTVVTGDVQTEGFPSASRAAQAVAELTAAVTSRDGFLGVLGNHDCHHLVDQLESRGVRMLVNEHAVIERGGERIHLSGVDDVHCFYTEEAERALRGRPAGSFSIALVHSPEMAGVAADAGYDLYLSGHTHGGQICLPGGRPVMTALDSHRELAAGSWRLGGMAGFTSRGVGVTHKARFNCAPEMTLIRLRRG